MELSFSASLSSFPTLKLPFLHSLVPSKTLTILAAGRSKKKPGGPSPGRLEGNSDLRRQAKLAARKRSRRLAENLSSRLNSPSSADPFSEDDLQMIGLGYDRLVRFMSPSDPNLRHPHDWFRFGRYGPYSWRGVVVGRPIRGRFSDERVSLIGEVRDHDEFERIERLDMGSDFGKRIEMMDKGIGLRFYWVFVRHPKWNPSDRPWEQWTLAAEVAVEARRKERLDKWSLMGRLGNKARSMVTQCAAWVRPDVIYVKRPVYQCRFEPQDGFLRLLGPLLDPATEKEYLFEVKDETGRVVDVCTYFGGLCKIVKINQKAFVDDVVCAYTKLSEEGKSRCLEFLLENHPMELLHPYTKEWKAKLEEMELGCDAPDESDDDGADEEVMDWVELDDGDDDTLGDHGEYEEDDEDAGIDEEESEEEDEEEEKGMSDDIVDQEESIEYWEKQWSAALKDSDAMERLVTEKIERTSEQLRRRGMYEEEKSREIAEAERMHEDVNKEEMEMVDTGMEKGDRGEGKGGMHAREKWESVGYAPGPKRRVIKSNIPPDLFLRAAVRPFTYRNLVKEIVLMRHAIIDGEIDAQG